MSHSWYSRMIAQSSVRDMKKEQTEFLINELAKSQEGCHIDKLSCEESVDAILRRIERMNGSDGRFLIDGDLQSYLLESLSQAKAVLRDSPKNFYDIIEDARIYLDEYLYELEMKG